MVEARSYRDFGLSKRFRFHFYPVGSIRKLLGRGSLLKFMFLKDYSACYWRTNSTENESKVNQMRLLSSMWGEMVARTAEVAVKMEVRTHLGYIFGDGLYISGEEEKCCLLS